MAPNHCPRMGAAPPYGRKVYYAAHGRFIIMSDAEDSYEFLLRPRFDEKLCHGFDLVRLRRLPSQGYGAARRDAMPAPLA